MIRAHNPYRAQQTGYVLPLTLAVLVMLSLIAAQVGSISRSAIDRVMAARERVQAEYLLESAKAEILHMLSLLPRSARGMGDGPSPIIPDGRTYAFNENVRVRFQDLRGLLPLNASVESPAPAERLSALLKTYGLPVEKTSVLIDSLLDYRDKDDLHRVNGAEKPQYLAAGKMPPRNADLQDVTEIYRIMGWAEETNRWAQDEITQYLGTQRNQAFNPNMAPARVISAVTGMGLQDALAIVKQRQLAPGVDISPLLFASLGDPFGSAGFVLRTIGPSIRVTLWHRHLGWGWQFVVHHTPDEAAGPWRISSIAQVPVDAPSSDALAVQALPPLKDLRPLVAPRIEYRF